MFPCPPAATFGVHGDWPQHPVQVGGTMAACIACAAGWSCAWRRARLVGREGSAAVDRFDESFVREGADGVPDGDAADAVLVGEFGFGGQPGAWGQVTGLDVVAQVVGYLLPEGTRGRMVDAG